MDFAAQSSDVHTPSSVLGLRELRGRMPARPDRHASYPPRSVMGGAFPVRRLAVSLPASFSAGLLAGPVSRLVALRFVWVAATCFPEDFHLLSMPMLGTHPDPLPRGERETGKRRSR